MKFAKPYTLNPIPSSRGFTLVELLVSVGLFGIVVALVTGIFTNALRNQRNLVALMAANDNVELALEEMAREMRTGFGFTAPFEGRIEFTNARGAAVAYAYDANRKVVVREENGAGIAITGRNVNVTKLSFLLNPQGQSSVSPTRITVLIEVTPTLPTVQTIATNLQISITPRS